MIIKIAISVNLYLNNSTLIAGYQITFLTNSLENEKFIETFSLILVENLDYNDFDA